MSDSHAMSNLNKEDLQRLPGVHPTPDPETSSYVFQACPSLLSIYNSLADTGAPVLLLWLS